MTATTTIIIPLIYFLTKKDNFGFISIYENMYGIILSIKVILKIRF